MKKRFEIEVSASNTVIKKASTLRGVKIILGRMNPGARCCLKRDGIQVEYMSVEGVLNSINAYPDADERWDAEQTLSRRIKERQHHGE